MRNYVKTSMSNYVTKNMLLNNYAVPLRYLKRNWDIVAFDSIPISFQLHFSLFGTGSK
jgi:hypothetical protein